MVKSRRQRRHRELVELAALFAAAGTADLFADFLGHNNMGPSILVGLGVALGLVTVGHHTWIGRSGAPPEVTGTHPWSATVDPQARIVEPAETVGVVWRVRTAVPDTPGRLAVLAAAFAAIGANILMMQVHPVDSGVVDEFLVEAPRNVTSARLHAAIGAAGGGEVRVTPADRHSFVDAPTHALALAARLCREPESLRHVLAELLGAHRIEWHSGESGRTEGIDDTLMYVRDPEAGLLVASRPSVPFTSTEYARARAMTDLVAMFTSGAVVAPSRP